MAVILSIETSTSVCSAAIHEQGVLLASEELHTPQSAASMLAVQIEKIFSLVGIPKRKLDAVAVSIGPGSYTGLRIGVATAKGICYGFNIPIIAIDSLMVMASSIGPGSSKLLCPMMDARRMEVYYCLLDTEWNVIEKSAPKVIDAESFSEQLADHSILFFGDGAPKCKEAITHAHAVFKDGIFPSAVNMGQLSWSRFQKKQFGNLEDLEPNYLKEFKAKTKMA